MLHLESQRGSETRRYLLDFGLTPEAYINNLESKDDPAAGDALILSHRHYDHMRGPVLSQQEDGRRSGSNRTAAVASRDEGRLRGMSASTRRSSLGAAVGFRKATFDGDGWQRARSAERSHGRLASDRHS